MVQSVAIPSSFASLGLRGLSAIVDSLEGSIRDDLVRRSHAFFEGVLVSAFIVAVGVVLEGPELFHEIWPNLFVWFTWNSEDRLRRFGRNFKVIGLIGWLLVGIGVAGEGLFEGLQNRAEGQLQTFNDILLKDAVRHTAIAIEEAEDASGSAIGAAAAADRAVTSAGTAGLLAEGARTEADTFKDDIASAKNKAADAVSRLSDAENQLAAAVKEESNAYAELNRLKNPRHLSDFAGIRAALLRFKGTQYEFDSVYADPEARDLLIQINTALDEAGWVRVDRNIPAFPFSPMAISIPWGPKSFGVIPGLAVGVHISIDSPLSIASLAFLPPNKQPVTVQAAETLAALLSTNILPVQEGPVTPLEVSEGRQSLIVRIDVGKKP